MKESKPFAPKKTDVTLPETRCYLMDLRLPDLSGLDVMIATRSEFADARIIGAITFEGDLEVQRALKGGDSWIPAQDMPA
jgi:CheY-like chemotaxis protein